MSGRPDPNHQPGDVKVVFNPETGISANYFGGEGRPDGPGHGHVDINEQGQVAHPQGGRPAGEKP